MNPGKIISEQQRTAISVPVPPIPSKLEFSTKAGAPPHFPTRPQVTQWKLVSVGALLGALEGAPDGSALGSALGLELGFVDGS